MQIRLITEDEIQEAYYLSAQAFRNGGREDDFAEKRRNDVNRTPATGIGVFDAAGMQAKVIVNHYTQVFEENFTAPMGGIGGVACLPASRGKGYAAAGLTFALEYMKDNGFFLSTLFPFSWAFYRKFGWEWVGTQYEYSCPTRILCTVPETENVRAATRADRPKIEAIYSQYAQRYRGMLLRDEKQWNKALADGSGNYRYTYIYESEDGPEGYLTFGQQKSESTWINEFISLTVRAQKALLGLLKRHEMQVESFRWNAPLNDTLWSHSYHNDLVTKSGTVVQARVVDIKTALESLKVQPEESYSTVLSIQDAAAPWNEGVWKIQVEGGVVAVSRTTDASDVSCDIQAFTQAYYGDPALPALRSADRLQVHNIKGYLKLNDLLHGWPGAMWLNDHF